MIVYAPVAPIVKFPTWLLAMPRVGVTTVVGSVAVGVAVSPPPLAVAELVTEAGAFAATLTVRVMGMPAAAAAMTAALVQVTVCPAALHVQPVPVAALNVRPVGSVSATVIVPEVATLPELLTAIVYVPVAPVTKDPECDFAMASVGLPASVVGSVAVGVFVAPPPLAVTELVTEPGAPVAFAVSVMGLPGAPAAMAIVLVQVALWPAPLQVHPVPAAALKVRPAGNASVTVIVPVVGEVPVLLTVIVYVPVEPIVKLPVWLLAIARVGVTTVVGSVAVGVAVSPPPLAVAELVTVAGAFAATLTVSIIGALDAPAAMTAALVHVTVCPAALHVQPVPVAALNVSPVGSVSVTVIVPDVATFPELLTAIVYVPVAPVTKEPVCDFVIASIGLPARVVGSVAVGVFEAPPPVAVTEFVTEPGAPTALTVKVMGFPAAPAAMAVVLVQVAV